MSRNTRFDDTSFLNLLSLWIAAKFERRMLRSKFTTDQIAALIARGGHPTGV